MNKKVAIYTRVSTEHEAQLSALDNQGQYYDDILILIKTIFIDKHTLFVYSKNRFSGVYYGNRLWE
jgi:hypothetical protein